MQTSAGLLIYRYRDGRPEVFLVHPGGPFWLHKDEHAWSIPKGLFAPDEDALDAARRELAEETGLAVVGTFTALAPLKQPSGKVIHAFAVAAEVDPSIIRSNSFEMEWPPRSGRRQTFPEVDRADWFPLPVARRKVHRGQAGLIDELERLLAASSHYWTGEGEG